MFLASAICSILVAANFQQLGTADIAEMVARKHKMSTSYRVQMRVETRHYVAPNVGRNAYTASIWRDGDKLRVDITDAVGEPAPPAGMVRTGGEGERRITCHNCERTGYFLITGVFPGNPKLTSIVGFHKTPALAGYFSELDIDWRFLGMTNNSLHAYKLAAVAEGCQNYLANPKRVLSRSVRDNKPCLVSSLTIPTSHSETYFFVDDGHNPIINTGVYKSDQGLLKCTTEIEWRKTPGNHLYPSRIRHSEMKGEKFQSDETINVIDADFHSPINPVVFTLAGLNLNDGQLIAYPDVPAADRPRWRNAKPALP